MVAGSLTFRGYRRHWEFFPGKKFESLRLKKIKEGWLTHVLA